MGGNATKHLGTERINKKEYISAYNKIADLLFYHSDESARFCDIPYYFSKEDFGDMDLISTVPRDVFDKLLKSCDKFEIVGRVNYSYALLDKETGKSFQLDYVYIAPETFDVAKNYFSFNDLGNFIGRISSAHNFKVGFDGLFKYVKPNYRDEKGFNKSFEDIKRTSDRMEIPLSQNWAEMLDFLGFDTERYRKGFETKKEIFDFVINSKYFNPDYFLFQNRTGTGVRRDKKRSTYSEFLSYLEECDFSNRKFMEYGEVNKELNDKAKQLFPFLVNKKRNIMKQYFTQKHLQARLNKDKIEKVMKKYFGLTFAIDENQANSVNIRHVKSIQSKIKEHKDIPSMSNYHLYHVLVKEVIGNYLQEIKQGNKHKPDNKPNKFKFK